MAEQESDLRLLVTEMRVNHEHQQKALAELTTAIKESNQNQTKLTAEVHSMVKTYIADRGRLDTLEKNDADKEKRLRNNENFIIALKPDIERKKNWTDKVVPALIGAAIIAMAGIFIKNPFS